MRRFSLLLLALALSPGVAPCAQPETAESLELHELRRAVEQQSKQIEILTEQVGKLTRIIEGHEGQKGAEPAAAKAPEPVPAPPPAAATESVKPAAEPTAEAPKTEAVPKAEAVAGGPKHVVAKGETLTSIAKHYNISVTDLNNANKIENERKLQIGQVLTIPPAKSPDTTEKKENP